MVGQPRLTVWYPVDLTRVPTADLADAVTGLRKVVGRPWVEEPDVNLMLGFNGMQALETSQARVQSATAVLVLAGVGPAGAAIAVLLLGTGVYALRQRPTVRHLLHRGATRRSVRIARGLEGLWICVPPTLLALAAWWLVRGAAPPRTGLIAAAVVALLPPLLLTLSPLPTGVTTRAETGLRRVSPYRWVAEAAVHVLALASVGLFVTSGVGRADGSVDLLTVSAPLLLALSAFLLVLRIYPLPLGLVVRRLARSRSTVAFLGTVRALRDRAGTLAPVFSALVGTAVATASVVTLTTLASDTRHAALIDAGADLRLTTTATIGDDLYAGALDVEGVAAAARIDDSRIGSVPVGDGERTVQIVLADLPALVDVQRGVPDGARALGEGILVSQGLADVGADIELTRRMGIPNSTWRVGATSETLAGVDIRSDWVLIDRADDPETAFVPRVMLVSVDDGADRAAVTRDLTALVPGSRVSDADDLVETISSSPLNHYLRLVMLGAVGIVVLAAICSVALALALTSQARARQDAILRVLGLQPRRRSVLAVWEQALPAFVASLVGVGLGVALAAMMRSAADLRVFTGGEQTPALVINPLALTALVLGFALVMTVAVVLGQRLSTLSTTRAVRLDEE